jgi:hypothetical protein
LAGGQALGVIIADRVDAQYLRMLGEERARNDLGEKVESGGQRLGSENGIRLDYSDSHVSATQD